MPENFGLDLDTGFDLGIPKRRRRKVDSFTPEQEESLLGTLGNRALGGVAMLGNVLDVPGSMVRDVIGGQNPFDQLLSPHTGENRVAGRDLLRQGGFIGSEDTTANWWGGLGTEILLDPTTYFSGGLSALGKGGKALKAAGVLDDAVKVGLKAGKRVGPRLGRMTTTFKEGFDLLDDAGKAAVNEYATKAGLDLASVADEPIQSLGRVSLPFTDIGFNFGSGKLSQGIAGGLDAAGEFLKASAPVRGMRALFDHRVGGKMGYAEQQIAEEAYKAKWKSERAVKAAHVGLLNQMSEGHKAFHDAFGGADDAAARTGDLGIGDVVHAADRNNYGYVMGRNGDNYTVQFHGDVVADVDLPKHLLTRVSAKNAGMMSFAENASYQLYDKVVRLAGELNGDVEAAWKTLSDGGQNLPEGIAKQIKDVSDYARKMNANIHKSIEVKGGRANWIAEREAGEGYSESVTKSIPPTPHSGSQVDPVMRGTVEDASQFRPWEASPDELQGMMDADRLKTDGLLQRLFGPERADKFRAALSNMHSTRDEFAAQARNYVDESVAILTPAERRELFDALESPQSEEALREWLGSKSIYAPNPKELGKDIADAISQISEQPNTPIEQLTHSRKLAAAKVLEAQRVAAELGWSNAEIGQGIAEELMRTFKGDRNDIQGILDGLPKSLRDAIGGGGTPSAPRLPPSTVTAAPTPAAAKPADPTIGFAHMPRYISEVKPKDLAELRAGKTLKTTHAGMQKRSDAIRTVPAEIVNRMLTDDALRGDNAVDEITNRFGQYLDPEFKIDDKVVGKAGHAKELASYISEHKQAPLFTRGTAEDFLKYQMGAQVVDRNLDAMHEIVSRTMGPTVDGPTVARAFKNANLTDEAIAHWAKKNGLDLAKAEEMRIPFDVANALTGVNRIYDQPEWAKAIGQKIDEFHGWWKNAMTVPFPAFHSRNFSSGQYMNMATGLIETPTDIAAYGGEFTNAVKMLTSTGVPRELQEELYTNGVLGKYTRAEDVGISAINANKLPGLPPSLSLNPLNALEQFRQTSAKMEPSLFDAVPGGRFSRTALTSVADAGSKVAENVEFLNRVPLYLYLRKKGWSAQAAAQKVDDLHVNYSDLAPFEKNVMRRMVPFYAFQRRIAPVIMQTILERPGGALSQTIKASADLSNADPLTPEHISSTLAIPNPLKDEGFAGASYLTGLGLPHEQLAQFLGGPQTVIREAVSQTSPILKGPLEWATGQSFFQAGSGGKGRDLEDLDPTIGRTIGNLMGTDKVQTPTALEHFMANMPTSRLLGTVRQATDTRKNLAEKAVNLLTGVKVSDVSEQNQERVIQQRALELMDEMGARTFEKPYFPKEIEAAMTPEEAQQAEALELLQAVLADRQKKRKGKK